MAPNHDPLRTRGTAYNNPLNVGDNVLASRRECSASPIYATYPNPLSPPTPAPTPQPFMVERRSSSGSSTSTIIPRSAPKPRNPTAEATAWASLAPTHLCNLPSTDIESLIMSTLPHLSPGLLMHLASILPARLKRDFLADLPPELSLYILSFVDDVKTLARASRVSRAWRVLVNDDAPWKIMCARRGFEVDEVDEQTSPHAKVSPPRRLTPGPLDSVRSLWTASSRENIMSQRYDVASPWKGKESSRLSNEPSPQQTFSYRKHFKIAYTTEANWRRSGRLLRSHRSQDAGVVTSLAMDGQWIVVGLANSRVHVFSAPTGVLARTLIGHEAGVWSLWLVSKGGGLSRAKGEQRNATTGDVLSESPEDHSWASRIPQSLRTGIGLGATSPSSTSPGSSTSSSSSGDVPFQSVFDSLRPPPGDSESMPIEDGDPSAHQSDPCNASRGWGQANALVVSGGCDKQIRVWDIKSGYCLYVLRGHRSTVRCIKVFHGRPVAVSGGRDHTLRVWDIQKGTLLRTLEGHTDSVRCLDVFGDQVVSGSYDCTVRLWNVDSGECLRVFNGHYHQVYTVAFDGERIASGGLDSTVRIWSASTGTCLALLQGHTALVCQLQLSSRTNTVVTGSADGRIIIFSIAPATPHLLRTGPPANRSAPVAAAAHLGPDVPASPPMSPSMIAADSSSSNSNSSGSGSSRDERSVDGRKSGSGYRLLARVPAHSSGVTGLQFDDRPGRQWVVSGGNDGRVQLWEFASGSNNNNNNNNNDTHGDDGVSHTSGGELRLVRDLTEPCEGLWKVAFRGDQAVICCLRSGRTVLEIWSFRPVEEDL